MPRAEVGSTKYLNNKLKSKGLQRLRWYCQVCERQMRDENGFKCHTQSEGHVRQMLLVGQNPNKAIKDFSREFESAFIKQLRTAHGTKPIHINHFYQEYINDKEHVHMNATRWPSLTEFAKYLGRQGICRVEETEKGIHIAWIDNSPEALRRQDAIRKKERMEKGDEEREQRLIEEQVARAQERAREEEEDEAKRMLHREGEEKVTLSFAPKTTPVKLPTPPPTNGDNGQKIETFDANNPSESKEITPPTEEEDKEKALEISKSVLKVSFGSSSGKPQNVFSSRNNPFASKKAGLIEQPKKMSAAERIMREEMERKRARESRDYDHSTKRQKT